MLMEKNFADGGATTDMSASRVRVAYLINQYPKVSHAFIRREIQDLERQGIIVERIALRGWSEHLVDPDDLHERKLTRYVVKDGLAPLLRAAAATLVTRPRAFLAALRAAIALSRNSERALPYHLIYLAHACRIRGWLEKSGATHVHAHFGTNAAEVALLVRHLGGPDYSFTVHGPEEFDAPRQLHLDKKIAGAKFVVAISSFCRSQLLRSTSARDWHKIKVVHCGLDSSFYRVPHASSPPSSTRFVCVGRLCEQKGQILLLHALRDLLDRGHHVSLVLAGDGEMRGEIEQQIRVLGLDRHVRITGAISSASVRDEILAARALVLPSFAEGLPVVIMEAMSLRRPVISTFVGGIPELVQPGTTGWLVPAGSVAELASAMAACLATEDTTLEQMGEHAHARVLERHAISHEAAKLAALFTAETLAQEA